MSFKDKVVLITGASAGIGANCAETFAHQGALLSIVGRNTERLAKVADKCKEISSLKPLAIVADVSTDAKRIIDETINRFGRLDVLINNAGIVVQLAEPMEPSSVDIYDKTMSTNVRAVYELILYAIPHLVATKGNIVNVSSVTGLRSFPGITSYCVSKAALDQLTKCIALELAPKGVRVNSVNPAAVRTDFARNAGVTEEQYAAGMERAKETHALGRIAEPQEVSNAILFLASDGASFVTGTLFPVCGGKSIMCPR